MPQSKIVDGSGTARKFADSCASTNPWPYAVLGSMYEMLAGSVAGFAAAIKRSSIRLSTPDPFAS